MKVLINHQLHRDDRSLERNVFFNTMRCFGYRTITMSYLIGPAEAFTISKLTDFAIDFFVILGVTVSVQKYVNRDTWFKN